MKWDRMRKVEAGDPFRSPCEERLEKQLKEQEGKGEAEERLTVHADRGLERLREKVSFRKKSKKKVRFQKCLF